MSNTTSFLQTNFFVTGQAQTASNIGVALNGSQPFTIAAWVQFGSLQNTANILVQDGTFAFGVVGRQAFVQIVGMPTLWSNGSSNPISENDWTYLACVFTGNMLQIYIDGELDTQATIKGSAPAGSNPIVIGSNLQGNLNCVRVYSSALSLSQILDAMFDPDPSQAYAAYFDFSINPPADTSGHNLPLTLTSGATVMNVVPSVSLTGTAYCQPIRDANTNPGGAGNDAYTIQAWIYVDNPNVIGATSDIIPAGQAILVNQPLDAQSGVALYLYYDTNVNAYRFASLRGDISVASNSLLSNATVSYGRWINVATTYDPATTTLSIYVNGAIDTSNSSFGAISPLSAPNVLVAGAVIADQPSSAWTLQGYVQSVDIWSICLDAAAIAQWQNGYPLMEPGLVSHYDFAQALPRDEVDGTPIGLADTAWLKPQTNSVRPGQGPAQVRLYDAEPGYAQLPPEQMASIRASISFDDVPDLDRLLDEAMRSDLEGRLVALMPPEMRAQFRGRLESAWVRARTMMRERPFDMRCIITHHKIAGEHILIHHTPEKSIVVFRAPEESISDCNMWRIQMIWSVVSALLTIFGIYATLTQKAMDFINTKILQNRPLMTVITQNLTLANVTGVFGTLAILQNYGVLWPLIKIALSYLSWYLLGRLVVKILVALFGTAAAVAETIAELVVAAAYIVYVWAQQPSNCPLIPSSSEARKIHV